MMIAVGVLLLILAAALEISVVPVAVQARTLATALVLACALFVVGDVVAVLGLYLLLVAL